MVAKKLKYSHFIICRTREKKYGVPKMEFQFKPHYDIGDLLKIMRLLRSENGCPWDIEQTHQSIRKNFIEETYEVVEAIDKNDIELLKEELGDVLLQVVFHTQMEAENGNFTFDDVADGICQKLILRHPHIFSDVTVHDADQVLSNWDKIKKAEKGQKSATETLEAVPSVLPALMRAQKVQQRAARAGFDYDTCDQAMADLKSEVAELEEALASDNQRHIEEELGDLIFSALNIARFSKLDGEDSLTKATQKFIRRFAEVERLAGENNIDMTKADLEQLNQLWYQAKQICQ